MFKIEANYFGPEDLNWISYDSYVCLIFQMLYQIGEIGVFYLIRLRVFMGSIKII